MPNSSLRVESEYEALRGWLTARGAQRAGDLGCVDDLGADFEGWVYKHYTFIIVRTKTGGATLFGRIGSKDSPASEITVYLRQVFRGEDMEGLRQKHHAGPGSCAMPSDEHLCNRPTGHTDEHHCACGWGWTAHADDNALLTHPADTKKKPERVGKFQI